ncbi:MAG: VWD domain-containing protein [Myxococcota bacterium]
MTKSLTRSCLLLSTLMLWSCGDDHSETPEIMVVGEVCDLPYLNTVVASSWAQAVSPIRAYRYAADIDGGFATIELLEDDGTVLGTMDVRQLFGQADAPDGALRATLNGMALTTTGRWGETPRYAVDATLSVEGAQVEIESRFSYERCFEVAAATTAPACAGALDLSSDALVVPSCGIIADNLILDQVAPVLRSVTYRTPLDTASPSVGGVEFRGSTPWASIRAVDQSAVDPNLATWVQDTGTDSILGTTDERLLTTAFMDRVWWRAMDGQIGFCEAQPSASVIRSALGSRCPGDHDASAWDQGNGGGGSNNAHGDPHMNSLDGFSFDFQAAGEFTLARSTDRALDIQFRTEARTTSPDVCAEVTWVTGIATRVGDRRVSITPAAIRVDGVALDDASGVDFGAGAGIEVLRSERTLRWADGTILRVSGGTYFRVSLDLPEARAGRMEGLLGNFDGRPDNDLALPTGEVLPLPVDFFELHRRYADAWRVDATTTLFDYDAGAGPETFAVADFPSAPVTLSDLPPDLADAAREQCLSEQVEHEAAMSSCILDAVCGSDSAGADAALQDVPELHQPPGLSELITGGAIEFKPTPPVIDDSPRADPVDRCTPRARPAIALYRESAVTLTAALSVGASASGVYDSPDDATGAEIPSGAEIQSWLLVRQAGDSGEVGLNGFVRFSTPIVGVQVITERQSSSDALLGAAGTAYGATTDRGLELGEDVFEISEDRRSLSITLVGLTLDHLRVLTEVN